jgi:hypothetical protein
MTTEAGDTDDAGPSLTVPVYTPEQTKAMEKHFQAEIDAAKAEKPVKGKKPKPSK